MNFLSRIFSGWRSIDPATIGKPLEASEKASSFWRWSGWPFQQIPATPGNSDISSKGSFSSAKHAPHDLLQPERVTDVTATWDHESLDLNQELERLDKVDQTKPEVVSLTKESKSVINSFQSWFNSTETKLENGEHKDEHFSQKEAALQNSLDELEDSLSKSLYPSAAVTLSSLRSWRTTCQEYAFTLALAKKERVAFKTLGPITQSKKDSPAREAFTKQEQRTNRLETEVTQLRKIVAEKSQHFFKVLLNHLELLAAESVQPSELSVLEEETDPSLEEDLRDSKESEPPDEGNGTWITKEEASVHLNELPEANEQEKKQAEELLTTSLIQARQRRHERERDSRLLQHPTGGRLLGNFQSNDSNGKKLRVLTQLMAQACKKLKLSEEDLEKDRGNSKLNDEVHDARHVVKEVEDALATVREEMEQVAEETKQLDTLRLEEEHSQLQEKIKTSDKTSAATQPGMPWSYVPAQTSKLAEALVGEILARKQRNESPSGQPLLDSLQKKFESKQQNVKKQLVEQELTNLKNYSAKLVNLAYRKYVEDDVAAALTIFSQEN
ncbi:MAG: hypothetical protein K2W99_01060 [Chthoniobacterales bacterium]|nr:hypothetical protein [Chthoniobacterales bacterium]